MLVLLLEGFILEYYCHWCLNDMIEDHPRVFERVYDKGQFYACSVMRTGL